MRLKSLLCLLLITLLISCDGDVGTGNGALHGYDPAPSLPAAACVAVVGTANAATTLGPSAAQMRFRISRYSSVR